MSRKNFVTGATGFVGSNLALQLIERGEKVKALVRPGADLSALKDLDVEIVEGDLLDQEVLRKGMEGCDRVYHVAASYALWAADYTPMYQANVEGTRKICQCAWDVGVQRIVYTSTVGCIGLPKQKDSRGRVIPTDESALAEESQMSNPYKHSKWLAEKVALEFARKGVPVVVVNPSAPVGPRDVKPTPTGQVIVDFLNRAMPAYLETGLNWVHVRDVAEGHILAAEKGLIGERYILGNQDGNWTMKETLDVLAELTGTPAPGFRSPYWLAYAAAVISEGISKITRRHPKAPIGGVKMAKYMMFFDPAKAVQQLSLPQTDPRIAFEDAIRWFRDHGYVGAE